MFDGFPSRRGPLKTAITTGGAAAFSAYLDGAPGDPIPAGTGTLGALPNRQRAWGEPCREDDHGNVEIPRHQMPPYFGLDGRGLPSEAACATVEGTFHALDRAYERGHEGVIWSVVYSPQYFDCFNDPFLGGVDLSELRALLPSEIPGLGRQDALAHSASGHADAVLEAEQVLLGKVDEANDATVDADLLGILSTMSWRTSLVGTRFPVEHRSDLNSIPDGDPVPKTPPLFMGFRAGFTKNQATEEYVIIGDGPFTGATMRHMANVRQRPSDWYDEGGHYHRVIKLFSPEHAEQGLAGDIGDNLGDGSGINAMFDSLHDNAFEFGHVGHVQEAARVNRDDEGNARLLHRHFESNDGGMTGLHFPSLQCGISMSEEIHKAMNGIDSTDVPTVRQRVSDGILGYIFVRRRGNFLVSPREIRALPAPTGEVPGLDD